MMRLLNSMADCQAAMYHRQTQLVQQVRAIQSTLSQTQSPTEIIEYPLFTTIEQYRNASSLNQANVTYFVNDLNFFIFFLIQFFWIKFEGGMIIQQSVRRILIKFLAPSIQILINGTGKNGKDSLHPFLETLIKGRYFY